MQFSADSVSFSENVGNATSTVKRIGSRSGMVSVDFATSDLTALAGSDYTATSGTLTWGDGDTADKTITVPVFKDGLIESTEAFAVLIGNSTGGASLGAHTRLTVALIDSNSPPTDISLAPQHRRREQR